ncbi:hypothetical protein QWJ41_19770 [Nocardioides sp. SOB44]|uniref:AP2/ERF domain-containing protein n=1 Tax=Nocardioides cremeus TaxID=3058044 RepID=A0ABT8TVI5_9ACTN|nr:hypothetical protein [Nocardioides cremeus]MDO3397971.1 hypothetical protein [Nocardioides cremeus]
MRLWTDEDSRDLDRRVKALRREAPSPPKANAGHQGSATATYDGVPRGYLSEKDLRRRKKVERAMQVRAEREANSEQRSETYKANRSKRADRVRWPKPKQKPNGRWLAVTTINKRKRGKTFDTEAEAQAWLDEITKEK